MHHHKKQRSVVESAEHRHAYPRNREHLHCLQSHALHMRYVNSVIGCAIAIQRVIRAPSALNAVKFAVRFDYVSQRLTNRHFFPVGDSREPMEPTSVRDFVCELFVFRAWANFARRGHAFRIVHAT
jgi:hypothetical protein